MKVDKITEIYVLSDVLDSGPFEGETLYNKAYKYGRYDICLEIAEARHKTADFEENVKKYEETGLSLYKDKATGRYYHMILWEEIICRLREKSDVPLAAPKLKEQIIDELGLPKPSKHSCYACTTKCKVCPIAERAGQCNDKDSAYVRFVKALENENIVEAITEAERMRDAWTK